MGYIEEFATVDRILESKSVTRGVDAFALSVIKAEKQTRRLFTYLVYQFPGFNKNETTTLRKVLANNPRVYFVGFIKGFDTIYPKSIKVLTGRDCPLLNKKVKVARNKIFHGQLTDDNLERKDLLEMVKLIRLWCEKLAEGALNEIGYDGFGRNSFHKSTNLDLWKSYKVQIKSIDDYKKFIKKHLEH